MSASVLRHTSVSSVDSTLTLVEPVTRLNVDEPPLDQTDRTPRTILDGDGVKLENTGEFVTDLTSQMRDPGWFELDENVIRGQALLAPELLVSEQC
jgi:hypothetical protein